MDHTLEQISEVVPELLPIYLRRIDILHWIHCKGPIGRKQLAEKLNMTERPLRTESEFLKRQQFIYSTSSGMKLTPKGEEALLNAQSIWKKQTSVYEQEMLLKQTLSIKEAKIVSGNADYSDYRSHEMGLQVSNYLNQQLDLGHHIIAITGGTTMLDVAKNFSKGLSHGRHFTVVAARGGFGDQLAAQANTISDILAHQLNGANMSLYTPEKVSEETYRLLLTEPSIQETLTALNQADVLLFSVGDALTMAKRRGLDDNEINQIREGKAVGEAFGCFYNEEGEIVYRLPRIGMQLKDLEHIELPILIAGGASKAEAIKAFAKLAPKQLVLFTDKGASTKVLYGESH